MANDYTVGDTIYFKFTTRAFATGIPTILAGTPVLSAYEDASITQITAGVSITVDLDGVVGLNLATIVATGGNGFESGKHYGIVITTGTVGGVSVVGEVIGQFTLEKSAAAVELANGTDGLSALKALIVTLDTVADAIKAVTDLLPNGGALTTIGTDTARLTAARAGALTDWIDGNRLDLLLDAILLDTGTTLDTKINDLQGATFSPATDSNEAIRNRGDAAWITGAGGSDRLLMVDTTIATLASQISFTLTAGSVDNDAYNNCTIVIEDVSTSTQKAVGIVSDYVGATKTITLKYDPTIFTMATTDKVYILAENALKSTLANRQLNVAADGDIAGDIDGNVDGTVAIVTTLTNLPSIPANWLTAAGIAASALDGKGDWNISKTGYSLSTAGILAIWHQLNSAIVTAGSMGKLLKDEITSVRMAILTDWIDGNRLDLLLDAIPTTKTGYALSSTGLDAISQAATGIVEIAKAICDRVLTGATHNITNSLGKRLRQIEASFVIHTGTAQAGSTSNTIKLSTGASATNNIYNGDRVIIVGGTGVGEHGIIIDYDGGTKIATVAETWVITPIDDSEYELVPATVDIETWQHNIVTVSGGLPDVNIESEDNIDFGATKKASINTECDTALIDYDPPTRAEATTDKNSIITEIDANETKIDAIKVVTDRQAALVVDGTASGTPTTTTMISDVTISVDNQFNGRILTFRDDTTTVNLRGQQTDIIGSASATNTFTFTALATAPVSGDTFDIT